MKPRLLQFLKALEAAIPPPDGCHHAITYAQYGSDETDWRDELALQIILGAGKFRTMFLDEGDLEKSTESLVSEIQANLLETA